MYRNLAGGNSSGRGAKQDAHSQNLVHGHLLFARIDDTYEKALDAATETLSVRYAMDFRKAAQRYCALGRPEQIAENTASSTPPACAT